MHRIRAYLAATKGDKEYNILELYGGVGTIGLNLDLTKVTDLECSDSNPYNEACFRRSVEGIADEALRKKLRYTPLGASDMCADAEKLKGKEVLIVDPPRKGMDEDVSKAINACDCKTLVYVSCGFKAFKRDFEALKEKFELTNQILGPDPQHARSVVSWS